MIEFRWSKISRKQKDFIRGCTGRINIAEGSVRSGKSIGAIPAFFNHLLSTNEKENLFIFVASNLNMCYENISKQFIKMYGEDIVEVKKDMTGRLSTFFYLPNGIKQCIMIGGAKEGGDKAIRGITAHGVLIDELTLINRNVWAEVNARIVSNPKAIIIATTNPDHPSHWVKKELIDNADGVKIKHWHFTLRDNLSIENVEEAMNNLTISFSGAELYRKRDGAWVAQEGVVYERFDEKKHMIKAMPKDEKIVKYFCGMDFGDDHYTGFVIFAKTNKGKYYLIEEVAERQKSIESWWIPKIKETFKKHNLNVRTPIHCDSAGSSFIRAMCNNGLNALKANKHNAVIAGINYINSLLEQDRLFFLPCFKKGYEEINIYAWDKKSTEDKVIKLNDDVLDAVRYALWEDKLSGETSVKVASAKKFFG